MSFLFALPASIHLYIYLSNFESMYLCILWIPEIDTARYGNALSQYMANFKIVSYRSYLDYLIKATRISVYSNENE